MKLKRNISHALLMAAGCGAMLIAIFTLTSSTTAGSWVTYLLLLLCPAMHFLMHGRMHGGKDRHDKPKAPLPAPKSEVPDNKREKLSG
jgi:hypothetical protein